MATVSGMTATTSPQATTTITCNNGRRIVVTDNHNGTHSVAVSGTSIYDTTFTPARIPADMTTAQAAAEYAGQLAAENGGRVMVEGEQVAMTVGAVEVSLLCVR